MATAKEANELKQQGALEAARDPNSTITADDAQKKILQESKEAGVTAFTFDPDASPEEKTAQARAVCHALESLLGAPALRELICANLIPRQAIPEGFHNPKRPKGVAIATDIDDGSKPVYDLPAPSKAGAVEVSDGVNGEALANGRTPEDGKTEMGENTGWAPRFGWPVESVTQGESLLDQSTWLETQLPEKFFGGMPPRALRRRVFGPLTEIMGGRVVPQRRPRHFRLPVILVGGCVWRRHWLDLHHHGCLLNLLPHIAPTSPPELPRRYNAGNGPQEARDRHGIA